MSYHSDLIEHVPPLKPSVHVSLEMSTRRGDEEQRW